MEEKTGQEKGRHSEEKGRREVKRRVERTIKSEGLEVREKERRSKNYHLGGVP